MTIRGGFGFACRAEREPFLIARPMPLEILPISLKASSVAF
jgi:hypothetical protein